MHVPQTEVLLRFDGAELARVFLTPGEYVIGRSPEADIYAETPLLSRKHARLSIERDHIAIQDLGSSNGTFVEDEQIAGSARVSPGQALRLGDVQLVIESAPVPPRGVPEELLAARPYAIGDQIARGGMGAILAAQQNALKRPVAMKVMLDDKHPDSVRRFVEEAQVTGQLTHPNIVPVYELAVDEQGQVFYTMKMVRGITLKKVIELLAEGVEGTKKKYPLPALLTVFQKACDAVAFAHAHGVIHRDLKPENIMLGDYGEVLVMDWGLAKRVARKDEENGGLRPSRESSAAPPSSSSFTASPARTLHPSSFSSTLDGTIMGTPAYMAPEQARGEIEALDGRSDIYALGAILFELLHLRPTVEGRSAMEIVDKVGRGEIAIPEAGRVPDSLAAVVRKAMALDQAARYRAVEDLQRDLTAYQNGFATSAENAGLGRQILLALKRHKAVSIATATALVVLAAGGATAFMRISAERTQVKAALVRLTATAPTFAAHARALLEEQKPEEALQTIDDALLLDPRNTAYHLLRGHLLTLLLRLDEAEAAYGRALPSTIAEQNRDLCARLRREYGDHPVSGGLVAKALWQQAQTESRNAEARYFSSRIQLDSAKLLATWQKYLGELGYDPKCLELTPGKELLLTLANVPVTDLNPLAKIPFTELMLRLTKVTDLSPLRGKPLVRFQIADGPALTGVTPLAGMPLQRLVLNVGGISDLAPIYNAPLRHLTIYGRKQGDWSFLRDLPLQELGLVNCSIDRLDPISGKQLQICKLNACPVTDLTPLRGQPIKEMDLSDMPVSDLSAIMDAPLERVIFRNLPVESLLWLKGKPLKVCLLWSLPLKDIEFLRGSAVEECHVRLGHPVDVSPLADCLQLRELILDEKCTGYERLRNLPKLHLISFRQNPMHRKAAQTAAEFWAEYDAKQKAAGAK